MHYLRAGFFKATYCISMLLTPFILAKAQTNKYRNESASWETADSKLLAKKYLKRASTKYDDHIIYDSKTRFVFEWDAKRRQPKVEEEGDVSVLALTDYTFYYDGLFQDDDINVDYVYGVNEYSEGYNLSVYKRPYEAAGIFHQDGEYVSFRLPDAYVTYGEIMKYKYQVTYHDLKYLTNAFIQKSNFIRKGDIEIWVPSWIEVDVVPFNIDGYEIESNVETGVKWTGSNDAKDRADEVYTVTTYRFSALPKTTSEYMALGPTYYMPHILFLNKSFDKEGERINLFSDVKDVYAWYSELINGLNKEPSAELKEVIDKITVDAKTDEEVLQNVFYWIQDNIRYIAFEDGIAGFKPEEANNVCRLGYADCKGMANLAKVMLNYKGIDARLTWLGTRRIAYSHSLPTLAADNHMICTVFLNGETYYIDPTEESVALSENAYRIQGREVLIENGDSFILKVIPEFDAFHNRTIKSSTVKIEGASLKGKVRQAQYGESKMNIIRGYNLVANQNKEAAVLAFLNNNNKNITIDSVILPDFNNRDSALIFNYEYVAENSLIKTDDKLFVRAEQSDDFYNLKFTERKTAYAFDAKYYTLETTSIAIPEGFEVAYMPKGMLHKQAGYLVKVEFIESNGVVEYRKLIRIEDTVLEPTEFEDWNTCIDDLRRSYNDYIIFKKVGA